jgi:hypothetical protein
VEEPRNPRLAHLHLFFRQANLKLCKRTIRLFRYKRLNPICMWLKRESLVPAELVWTDTARFALTLDEKPRKGRRGLTAPQVLRSLVVMRVKNWDYRELRERIADGCDAASIHRFLLRSGAQT